MPQFQKGSRQSLPGGRPFFQGTAGRCQESRGRERKGFRVLRHPSCGFCRATNVVLTFAPPPSEVYKDRSVASGLPPTKASGPPHESLGGHFLGVFRRALLFKFRPPPRPASLAGGGRDAGHRDRHLPGPSGLSEPSRSAGVLRFRHQKPVGRPRGRHSGLARIPAGRNQIHAQAVSLRRRTRPNPRLRTRAG